MYSERYRELKTDRSVDSSAATPIDVSITRVRAYARIGRTDRTPDVLLLEPATAPAGLDLCLRCAGVPLGRFLGAMPRGYCPVCWHRWGRGTPIARTQLGKDLS